MTTFFGNNKAFWTINSEFQERYELNWALQFFTLEWRQKAPRAAAEYSQRHYKENEKTQKKLNVKNHNTKSLVGKKVLARTHAFQLPKPIGHHLLYRTVITPALHAQLTQPENYSFIVWFELKRGFAINVWHIKIIYYWLKG